MFGLTWLKVKYKLRFNFIHYLLLYTLLESNYRYPVEEQNPNKILVSFPKSMSCLIHFNLEKPNFYKYIPKVSFFWEQPGHEFQSSPASDWLTYLVYHLEACFFGRKPLEIVSWLGSQKKLTLVTELLELLWYMHVTCACLEIS